jgi:hypothetical protein
MAINMSKKGGTATRWTIDEYEELVRLNGQPLSEIQRVLEHKFGTRRTISAITDRALKCGINLKIPGYGTPELGRFFGVHRSWIRRWIEIGLLRADEQIRVDLEPRIITAKEVETFMRTHPYMYDLNLLDKSHSLYTIAVLAHRGEKWLSPKEIAPMLGASTWFVRVLAHKGVLPCVRRSDYMYYFRLSEIRSLREIVAERLKASDAIRREQLIRGGNHRSKQRTEKGQFASKEYIEARAA